MIKKTFTLLVALTIVASHAKNETSKEKNTPSLPDLEWASFSNSSQASPGEAVTFTFSVRNGGSNWANYSFVQGFFSEDAAWDQQDPQIGSSYIASLTPGQSRNGSITYTLPNHLEERTYYLWFVLDATERVNESNEYNNIYIAAIDVVEDQGSGGVIDLQATNPTILDGNTGVPTTSLQLGNSVTLNADTWNSGTANALSSKMQAFLSSDAVFGAGDQLLATFDVPPVLAGQAKRDPYNRTITLPQSWPTSQGYIIFKADAWLHVYESNENNNTLAVAVSLSSASKRKNTAAQEGFLGLHEAIATFTQPNIAQGNASGSRFDAEGRILVERIGTADETNYFYHNATPSFVLVEYSNGDFALRQLSTSGLVLNETRETEHLTFAYDSYGKLIRIIHESLFR